MPRFSASSHGESRLRMLRVVRRGDRHDPKDLTVVVPLRRRFRRRVHRTAARDGLLPGEALKNLVHAHRARPRQRRDRGVRPRALRAAPDVVSRRSRRVRVEIAEQLWARLEAGGKAQGQVVHAGGRSGGPRRSPATASRSRSCRVSTHLALMRIGGPAPPRAARTRGRSERPRTALQRLLVGALGARWTYTQP